MSLINCHVHTENSHDGKGTVEENCIIAINNGLSGFAVTDHCDCEYADNINMSESVFRSFESAKEAQQKHKNELTVIKGVEIGEAIFNREFATRIINAKKWDMILGSVHAVRIKNYEMPFSVIDFSKSDDEFLYNYIHQYFEDVKETVLSTDYDILSHLTVIYRYIIHKYNRKIDTAVFYPAIEEVLKIIINEGKTLEVNTSGMSSGYLMPDIDILKLYRSLGGNNISIGSDSHTPANLTIGLAEGTEILKNLGFGALTYYKDRKPYKTKIK